MKRLVGVALAVLLLAGMAAGQLQLEELAVTAVAGPGWDIEVQGSLVVGQFQAGLLIVQHDSVDQQLNLINAIQINAFEIRFHPSLPLLYLLAWNPNFQLYMMDLTIPQEPVLRHLLDLNPEYVEDFAIDDNYLYVLLDDYWLGDYGVLLTYDNEDPWNPRLLDSTNIYKIANEVEVDGNQLYGIGGSLAGTLRFGIFDFTDPFNPALIYNQSMPWGTIHSAGGGFAAVGTPSGLYVFDPSPTTTSTFFPGWFSQSQCLEDRRIFSIKDEVIYRIEGDSLINIGIDSAYSFHIEGNSLYANSKNKELQLWNLSPSGTNKLDSIEFLVDTPEFLVVKDQILAVTGGETKNILVYDCTMPNNPELLSEVLLNGESSDLCIYNSYVYAFSGESQLAIIDITEPTNPIFFGPGYLQLPPIGNYYEMVNNDSFLFVSGSHHLMVFDITDPAWPNLVHELSSPSDWWGSLFLLNDLLIVGNNNLVDIFEADQNLNLLSSVDPTGNMGGLIAGHGDTLLVGGHYSFDIYSLINPESPQFLMNMDLPGLGSTTYSGFFDGTYLYMALRGYPNSGDVTSLTVLESEPGSPNMEIMDYSTVMDNATGDIVVDGEIVYFAERTCVGIFYFGDYWQGTSPEPSSTPALPPSLAFTPHPNPTNGALNWAFTLPQAGEAVLELVNLQGQTVGRCDLGRLEAGSHAPAWFPDGLASGIYLARIEAGKWSAQQKIVHLK
ncbi:MAG: T9SS C-terminal target domain-containing protein [Candidatus Zixiibacteriota bacterium]|nr:MAG: T9SS C-terminal target domain-containing protein [candidate division Zixibacteria bacterium]